MALNADYLHLTYWLDLANVWIKKRCDLIPITFWSTLRLNLNDGIMEYIRIYRKKISRSSYNWNNLTLKYYLSTFLLFFLLIFYDARCAVLSCLISDDLSSMHSSCWELKSSCRRHVLEGERWYLFWRNPHHHTT